MDKLQIVRGTHAKLIEKIDEYPDFSPCFSTDLKSFYIKYEGKLVEVGNIGAKIVSIEFSKIENGITYYKATLSDGSEVSFPFNIKLDTTTIAPGELTRMKADGTIEGTGIIFNSVLNRYESRYDFKFPSNSIWIGENVKIGQKTGFVYNHTKSLNKDYLMMDYEIDKVTGSKKPLWRKIEALETGVQIQADSSESLQNLQSVHIGPPSFERYVQSISFIYENDLHNFCMELVINGEVIEHYPSENAWNGEADGYTIDTKGLSAPVKITLIPEIINLLSYDVTINMKADEPINLKGKSGVPYYELDLNRMENKTVAVMEDLANIDTTGLAKKDLSNVNTDDIKAKGFMKTDMADVDLAKLYDKGIDAKLADGQKVADIQKEIDRIGNQPKQGDLPVFVYRGNEIPTIPSTVYKAFYLHFIVLKDSLGQFTFPSNAPNGAICSIENNDRDDYINIYAPAGETINGKTGVFQANSDTLSFFVKNNTDWVEAFGGVFPNSMDALRSTIKVLLPNSLNTIDEISNQLKDRLHTFAQIQTEFATQLHTFNDIESDLVSRGYMKGLKVSWGLSDIKTPIDDNWISGDIEPNQHIVPAIQSQTKYLLFRIPTSIFPIIDGAYVGQDLVELTPVKVQAIDALDYRILATDDKVDLSSQKKVSINYDIQGTSTNKGIELDDGTENKAGVTKINLINMKLSNIFDDSTELTLTAEGEITGQDNDNKEFPVSKIQSLDGKIRISNLGSGVMDLDANYNTVTDGIFAKLGMDEDINTDFHDQRPYFSDMYDNSGMYVGTDWTEKAFTIQEGDMLDPNVTGGSTFNIGMYFEPLDYNEASQDGYVELKVIDVMTKDYLLDIDGNPVAIRREYKAGTVVGKELLLGIVRAKGQKKIAFEIDVQFGDQILRASSNTCIYIQEVDKEHNSGLCEALFQRHTGYTINKIHRYYGINNMNLAASLVKDKPEGSFDNGNELMGNGIFFDSRGKCKVEISGYHIIIQDNGTDLPVFSLGKLWDAIDTKELLLKTLNAKVVIVDKSNAFIYALMKWTGEGPATLPILTGYNNDSPVFAQGWAKVSQKFISEDVVSGDHTDTNAFTVPTDAKQIAMIIYPVNSEIPTVMKLKDFEVDVSPSFTKTIIQNTSHITEEHLKYEKNMYKATVYTPSGYASYRYTVGNVDTKLPIGVIKSGDGKIINDNSWTDVGSSDPNKTQGDFKFLADGTVTVDYQARCFNEQNTINQIQFWLAKSNGDGTFTEVADSRYASTIEGSRKVPKMINSGQFTFDVKANETYRFFGKSDKSDGFYVQSDSDGIPLLQFIIDFNELQEYEQQVADDIARIDNELVVTQAAKDAKAYIELDWKDGKPVLSQKVRG